MKRRTDYKVCEFCGCSLDIGEACDCKEAREATERPQRAEKTKKVYFPVLELKRA